MYICWFKASKSICNIIIEFNRYAFIFKFDSKILLRNLGAYYLRLPQNVCFADTIDLMKILRQNGHRGRNGKLRDG